MSLRIDVVRHRQKEPAGHDAAAYVEEFKDLCYELPVPSISSYLDIFGCISDLFEVGKQLELSWSETLKVLGRSAVVKNTQPLSDVTWRQPVQFLVFRSQ